MFVYVDISKIYVSLARAVSFWQSLLKVKLPPKNEEMKLKTHFVAVSFCVHHGTKDHFMFFLLLFFLKFTRFKIQQYHTNPYNSFQNDKNVRNYYFSNNFQRLVFFIDGSVRHMLMRTMGWKGLWKHRFFIVFILLRSTVWKLKKFRVKITST